MLDFSGLNGTIREGEESYLVEIQGLNLLVQGADLNNTCGYHNSLNSTARIIEEMVGGDLVVEMKYICDYHFAVLADKPDKLKALSEERLKELRGRSWVECFCKDCGKIVYTSGSERHDADYQWICSNDLCERSKHAEHLGDMDAPDWAGELPENIGKLVERKWRRDKGMLQRLYESGASFSVEVEDNNEVIGTRILKVGMHNEHGEGIGSVLSDSIVEGEQWLLKRWGDCNPASVEQILKEEKRDNGRKED